MPTQQQQQEPADVASLHNVKTVQHEPSSQKNGRITQHYGASLRKLFNLYPVIMKYVIINTVCK